MTPQEILEQADANPETAPVYYDYGHQAWVEDGKYAKCGHRSNVPAPCCYACKHAGEEVTPMTARMYGTVRGIA